MARVKKVWIQPVVAFKYVKPLNRKPLIIQILAKLGRRTKSAILNSQCCYKRAVFSVDDSSGHTATFDCCTLLFVSLKELL
eukprot:c37635_g1_i1 orf=71-313(+)